MSISANHIEIKYELSEWFNPESLFFPWCQHFYKFSILNFFDINKWFCIKFFYNFLNISPKVNFRGDSQFNWFKLVKQKGSPCGGWLWIGVVGINAYIFGLLKCISPQHFFCTQIQASWNSFLQNQNMLHLLFRNILIEFGFCFCSARMLFK